MVEGQRTRSNLMKPILLTAAGNPENQDRGLVIQDGSRAVLCVTDGAGGLSGGAEAATLVVELVRQNASLISNADSCAEVLRKMDATVAKDSIAGETTCSLAIITSEEIFGASVGDSRRLADSGRGESPGHHPSAATQTVHWFWQRVACSIPTSEGSRWSASTRDGWIAQVHLGRTDNCRLPGPFGRCCGTALD